MFDWIKKAWKGITRMFDYMTLKRVLNKDLMLSQAMIESIEKWRNMLDGKAGWVVDPVISLRIESGICREFADAVLVEMETGIENNDKLDKAYRRGIAALNENMQAGLGLGAFILRPLDADRAEFVAADKFIPITFDDSGGLTDVAFLAVKRVGEHDIYIKLERHYFTNGSLTIESKCYHSMDKNHIGVECALTSVEEWAKINPGPVQYPGMTCMDFGYYRNPIQNKVDGSFCGVSIFASAEELIQKADIQAARLDWEYESGERVIHVDDRALRQRNGRMSGMAKLNGRLYRGLNLEDGKDKELLREYSPEMRDAAYISGLERYYRIIEFNVGLAYGDLSDVQEVSKTATEIKASKARKYNRVTAIQTNLEMCLESFAAAVAFYNKALHSGYQFVCRFNDSILVDEETERQQDRADVAMGALMLYEYRMKWYHETEEQAKAAIQQPAEVIE